MDNRIKMLYNVIYSYASVIYAALCLLKGMVNSVKTQRIIKFIALLLSAAMLILSAAGCGATSATAISFGDVEINANEYCYWMSRYKAMFLYSYFGTTTDNDQIWSSEFAEGVTVGDFLETVALSNIMSNAICLKLFDDYGLKLTTEQQNSIDDNINTKIQAVGSKSALNTQLSAYGVNVDMLRDIYESETKISTLQDYLYGENGTDKATTEEIDAYYEENYYRCKHILIRTDVKYELDENGDPIVDEESGSYKTVELTDEEIEEQKALAEDLELRVAAGEDFDALVVQYSEDTGMQHFADGYYINSACTFLPSEVVSAVISMNVGDIKTVESDYGIHIIKRYELIDGAYNDAEYAAYMFGDLEATVNSIKLQELLGQYTNLVVINEEIVADYPLAKCTPNFYY